MPDKANFLFICSSPRRESVDKILAQTSTMLNFYRILNIWKNSLNWLKWPVICCATTFKPMWVTGPNLKSNKHFWRFDVNLTLLWRQFDVLTSLLMFWRQLDVVLTFWLLDLPELALACPWLAHSLPGHAHELPELAWGLPMTCPN